jgi:hypothetical protein
MPKSMMIKSNHHAFYYAICTDSYDFAFQKITRYTYVGLPFSIQFKELGL